MRHSSRLWVSLRSLPAALWLISAATLVFFSAWSLVFPFLGVYMVTRLHASVSDVGFVLGLAYFAAIPVQLVGGQWADRYGRKSLMLAALAVSALLFGALAASHWLWLTMLLAVAQGATGWPLFLVASNTMVVDVTPEERRAEAFGLVRTALNAGAAIGPALAGLALAAHVALTTIFAVAAGLCGALTVVLALRLAETRPVPIGVVDRPSGASDRGYANVLSDRRFLAFCAISLLCLYCFGHCATTLPVYLTSVLHLSPATWGYLFAFDCVLVVALQFPVIHLLADRDPLPLLAVAAALIAVGIGGMAFAHANWSPWLLMALFAGGEILFVPLSSSVVSLLATEAERGRYMGVWSLVWISGQGLAPTIDGLVTRTRSGRTAYALVLVVGAVTVLLYVAYAALVHRLPTTEADLEGVH